MAEPDRTKMVRRPAYYTFDEQAKAEHGMRLYYFGLADRAPPPYNQQHVSAILDIANDGTLAGVELIDNMPDPPPAPEPTNDAVSDERLCQHLLMIDEEMCSQEPATVLRLAHEAADALNRRSVTSQASEGEVVYSQADFDESYEIGKRDGYEQAVQEIDWATGGDGEFKGSTFPGETVDEHVMKQRIIDRLAFPSKRVERLETALREIDNRATLPGGDDTPYRGQDKNLTDLRWIADRARQALAGRS